MAAVAAAADAVIAVTTSQRSGRVQMRCAPSGPTIQSCEGKKKKSGKDEMMADLTLPKR
jgi:hypothetical protein